MQGPRHSLDLLKIQLIGRYQGSTVYANILYKYKNILNSIIYLFLCLQKYKFNSVHKLKTFNA